VNRTYYYARVSSKQQNLTRQIDAFKQFDSNFNERNLITDKISGKNLERPGYKLLKDQLLRSGDVLVVESLTRLSRNKEDLKGEIEFLKDNNIRLKVLDLPSTLIEDTKDNERLIDMVNNIIIEVLASFAEQERSNIKKNQRQGIDAAMKKGVKFGRPEAVYPLNWQSVYLSWKSKEIKAVEAMQLLGLKHTTFYKLVRKYEGRL
jgi:DNA invertase Pin-like site-specific DNA recombinase